MDWRNKNQPQSRDGKKESVDEKKKKKQLMTSFVKVATNGTGSY